MELSSLLIRKFIRRVFRVGPSSEPRIIRKQSHGIGREAISYGSRKVCEVLQERGFAAYVVGGAVRDLLLGLRPKDFDVATDASPEDVHKVFRRSRLIGRRFRSEEHTSELQSHSDLVCRLLLEKKKKNA